RDACKGKSEEQYAGFAQKYKTFVADSKELNNAVKGIFDAGKYLVLQDLANVDLSKETPDQKAVKKMIYLFRQKMAKDPFFGLFVPVEYSSFTDLKFALGKKEGLKLNQGFDVYVRTTSNKLKYRGYVRVRSVGDNREKMKGNERVRVNPNAPLFSTAEKIIERGRGGIMKGMLLFESPYRAWSASIRLGVGVLGLLNIDPDGSRTFMVPMLQLESMYDLSPSWNISEIYLSFALDAGFFMAEEGRAYSSGFPFGVHVGLIKKFYFRQLSISLGVRAGISWLYSQYQSLAGIGGEGILGFDYLITPRWVLFLHLVGRGHWTGWNTILSGDAEALSGLMWSGQALLGLSYAF
ncbi:MAG: hypothetical protein AAGJ35_15330, partial [Myxococcota bacterium]